MADKKYADIRIGLMVAFEDNGVDDLKDQAMDALAEQHSLSPMDFDTCEVLGEVRDTESPAQ